MRLLYLNITTFFANRDMLDACRNYTDERGDKLDIIEYPYVYDEAKVRYDAPFEEKFRKDLKELSPDFVFSFNFLPVISRICNKEGIIYVSWIYDNPEVFLYSCQVINPCNIVCMFDSKQYEIFRNGGISTVYYLPLAASTRRLDAMLPDALTKEKFEADISFVGSLYTERKQYYDEIASKINPYTLGYIDGLVRSQLQVYGINFIEESLTPEVVADIQKASNIYPYPDGAETTEYLYANFIINRRATILERKEILTMIGKEHEMRLYTYSQNNDFSPEGIVNMGPADYFEEMPYIFKLSRINLNITLRSIQNAIPLRGYDIMGAGGFLLSNYQVDLQRHFVPGEEYVYYESREDLMDKINYYLKNETERAAIAKNGHDRVMKEHTFDVRVKEIIELVKDKKI